MIKLLNLIEAVYVQKPEEKGDEDLMKKGFKLSEPTTNPETGAITTDVEYLPEFEEDRRKILTMRKSFQVFKFSSDPDIAKLAKDINTNMTKLSQMIFALEKMIELQRKSK